MIDEKKELQMQKTVKKTRAINQRIVVRMIDDKPYYSIRYFDLDDFRWHVGYSSYKLEFVVEWLRTCFDVVDTKSGWIPVSERLPNEEEFIGAYLRSIYAAEFIVMIKGASKPTTLYFTRSGKWFDEKRNTYDVIAWQPLPEPYQNDEQEEK